MSEFIIQQLKDDRTRAFEVLDATRKILSKDLAERDARIKELHDKLVAANDRNDPLNLKICHLETALRRLRKRARP